MNLAIGVAGHKPGYVMEPACSTGWVGLLDADKALVGRVSTPELCALIVGLLNAPDMVQAIGQLKQAREDLEVLQSLFEVNTNSLGDQLLGQRQLLCRLRDLMFQRGLMGIDAELQALLEGIPPTAEPVWTTVEDCFPTWQDADERGEVWWTDGVEVRLCHYTAVPYQELNSQWHSKGKRFAPPAPSNDTIEEVVA
ncbi:TPA: hypothetical protein ACF4EW_002627 [Pseudomonas aeruginosa]